LFPNCNRSSQAPRFTQKEGDIEEHKTASGNWRSCPNAGGAGRSHISPTHPSRPSLTKSPKKTTSKRREGLNGIRSKQGPAATRPHLRHRLWTIIVGKARREPFGFNISGKIFARKEETFDGKHRDSIACPKPTPDRLPPQALYNTTWQNRNALGVALGESESVFCLLGVFILYHETA